MGSSTMQRGLGAPALSAASWHGPSLDAGDALMDADHYPGLHPAALVYLWTK